MGICLWLQWRNFLCVADGNVWEDLQCVDNGDVNCVAFYVLCCMEWSIWSFWLWRGYFCVAPSELCAVCVFPFKYELLGSGFYLLSWQWIDHLCLAFCELFMGFIVVLVVER